MQLVLPFDTLHRLLGRERDENANYHYRDFAEELAEVVGWLGLVNLHRNLPWTS